jgi:NhaA family Na+:H+ antiporter
MHQEFTQLRVGQTVGEALDWLRQNPPAGRVIYFYVVDADGRLLGVVPTRRLILSPREVPLTDIMVGEPLTVPSAATVLEACEFFIQHRLLAFPVVDEANRLLGVVDVDLYTDLLHSLDRPSAVSRLVEPLTRFFHIEASGGLVLLAFTAVALVVANSPLAKGFDDFWHVYASLSLGGFSLKLSLQHAINDGLMTLFFFVVGLEIKRELTTGELADPRKALLPVVAAVGGMVVPAAVYALWLWGRPGAHGWGVPMATDIAFVVGFLTLFGPRAPAGLKILLLTLAIADDIGAVLVIAVAYSTEFSFAALGFAGVGFGLVLLMRRLGVRGMSAYAVVGVGIWLAVLKSGVHPTVAGVLLGLLTPARPAPGGRVLFDVVGDLVGRLRGDSRESRATPEAESPLDRLEAALHPWVAFVIMPLFALANAGVAIELAALTTPVSLAVIAGLALGKPLGIVLFSWASVRVGLTKLPEGMTWKVMVGAGCLGGIGFTMSLFIAGLAFEGELRDDAKIGILAGSALVGIVGALLLLAFLPRAPAAASHAGGEPGSR